MKRKIFLTITLLVLALGVACSGAPSGSVAADVNAAPSTEGSSAEGPSTEGSLDSQSEPLLVLDENDVANENEQTDGGEINRPDGWREESHSNSAEPDYDVVFPENEVNSLTIVIEADDWQAMLDDMTAAYGEPGSGGPGAGGPAAGGPGAGGPGAGGPGGGEPAEPGNRPAGAGPGAAPGGAMGGDFSTENPIWVAATIEFEGDAWTDVGVRFKGNSSLKSTWSSGSLTLPFKLDFDEFEDENPAIDDQRFYGFKQLSLSNNFNDATFMRDVVTSDIMAGAGIASAETAFYELFVDYGEGPVSFGLYTMIEVVDDTAIERVFGDDEGNIYEADGSAASLAKGTFEGIAGSFPKENNEEEADWSDIQALYTVLHSDTRQSEPEAWKAALEEVFDVDTFLHWLAVNTVIENWDTYGAMAHNFYLYNNPETGQLTWIPWDHNEALNEGKRSSMTLGMEAIGDEWPLISYLLADSEYYNIYVGYISETINTQFEPGAMVARYQALADLIQPYAAETVGADAFARALQQLIDHTYAQAAEAETFLAQ